ncbi:MAG: carbamoyltransferase HypF [Candidatus Ratteibacteria bacterium]|nr:carbamoyltransferase HypF [Candidatus Ratteibacteria bacterium]
MARIRKRTRVSIEGRVQGVGFRPTVFRYAVENNLTGFVCNTTNGVYVEVEGRPSDIKEFVEKLKKFPPSRSRIKNIFVIYIAPLNKEQAFRIIESKSASGNIRTELSPDIATCDDCLKELFNPKNRRYLFPFINCTNCGPRFTITEKLPYDRKHTTMKIFRMCSECLNEYNNPTDRRFHAQPDCCFTCGPDVFLFKDRVLSRKVKAIEDTAKLIRDGHIVAVKGTGGYHLVCDANNRKTVKRLRETKERGDKPFALMAKDIETIKRYCVIGKEEEGLLTSWRTPIVLLKKKQGSVLPEEVAPSNRYLGFFLPYTPLHHLLFYFKCPDVIIATSANRAESPIIFKDTSQDIKKLAGISDYILTNNRPIKTGCDDSVVSTAPDKKIYIMRKARGYTPELINTPVPFKQEVFAAGTEEKNTIAFGRKEGIVMSQHTGTQEDAEAFNFYREVFNRFTKLFGFSPRIVAYDLHPDYLPTRFAIAMAEKKKLKSIGIQHHHSHIASCMLDNNLPDEKVIGVAFDGTGYGEKGDIRGAEFLIADYKGYERYAFLDYIPLPGGEKAIREVWRIGFSLLFKTFGDDLLKSNIPFLKKYKKDAEIIIEMLKKDINCVPASSMGRLFDGVSAILDIRGIITYEAQAAIELEMEATKTDERNYPFDIKRIDKMSVIDPAPMVREIVSDIGKGVSRGIISYRFHRTISTITTEICKRIKEEKHIYRVVLSGGVFQNTLLLNMVWNDLKQNGFSVFCHHNIPPNDAGISAGQAVIALYSQH